MSRRDQLVVSRRDYCIGVVGTGVVKCDVRFCLRTVREIIQICELTMHSVTRKFTLLYEHGREEVIWSNVHLPAMEAKDGSGFFKTGFQKRAFTKSSRSALVRTFVATADGLTWATLVWRERFSHTNAPDRTLSCVRRMSFAHVD